MFFQKKKSDGEQKLLTFLSGITNKKELEDFLRALLTPSEYEQLCERLEIVTQLLEKKTQRDIAKNIGVSLATISRGSREIKFGNGIFQTIFQRFS